MAISFKSVGHFLATAFQVLTQIAALAPVVEEVTSIVPGASPSIVTIERAAFAVLGEIASLLSLDPDAASKKLSDAGVDTAVITQVKTLLADVPTLVALAKAL